jgi:Protein of unknown function (DUF1566)
MMTISSFEWLDVKASILVLAVLLPVTAILDVMAPATVAAQQRRAPTLAPQQQTALEIILDRLDNLPRAWSEILPAETRFKLVMGDAAVLDRETGLVWEKSPSDSSFTWNDGGAEIHCIDLSVGNRKGWRLPMIRELLSLVDPTQVDPNPNPNRPPALPAGHPFTNVPSQSRYWSANTINFFPTEAWGLDFSGLCTFSAGVSVCTSAFAAGFDKDDRLFVWCVRGGQGVDSQ